MQKALSLSLSPSSKTFITIVKSGFEFTSETLGYEQEYRVLLDKGGIFDQSHWEKIWLKGKDAVDYLQRMTTVNFKTLAVHGVSLGAFLTGRGHVVALGYFVRETDGVSIWVGHGQRGICLEHIEKFHFAESFEVADDPSESSLWAICSPTEVTSLNEYVHWKDAKEPKLVWVSVPKDGLSVFWESLVGAGKLELLGQRLFDFLRISSGFATLGAEISADEIILETGLDEAVARNKGCYPGQEVVERIYTYGSVNRKLFCVKLKGDLSQLDANPLRVEEDGKVLGSLVSWMPHPTQEGVGLGLMYIQKAFWSKGASTVNGVNLIWQES